MLRKRSRSVHKDEQHSGSGSGSGSESFADGGHSKNPKNNSFYTSIPGLLVGLSPKGLALADCDSVRSPTSPLDFRLFSGLGYPFRSSTTKFSSSWHENVQQRSFGNKLGLISIIDSLDGGDDNGGTSFSGKVLRSSSSSSESSKNILFGPKLSLVNNKPTYENTNPSYGLSSSSLSSSPKSLTKSYSILHQSSKPKSPLQKETSDVLFEIADIFPSEPEEPDSFGKIRSCSVDSCRTISNLSGLRNNNLPNSSLINNKNGISVTSQAGSYGNGFIGSLSATEIELSEDYTRVISHGTNPKTTHIFGDCILKSHTDDSSRFGESWEARMSNPNFTTTTTTTNADSEMLHLHYFLSICYTCNKKLEGKDIYIYRGVKAFCSLNCRSMEILNDEFEKLSDKESENPLSLDHDVDDDCNELFF